MFSAGSEQFKSYRDYYSQVMNRYFRRNPPIPTNYYLSGEASESEELKIQIVRHCHFPSIINILANDESDLVRRAARETRFWKLAGRYQDILGFGKRERRAFARIEGHPNILVLLMFEDDADVINEVLHNPSVSLQILVLFQQLLKERGAGRKDEQLQMIAKGIISERRAQIIKISEINKAEEQISLPKNIELILQYLAVKDITVHRAVENILNAQSAGIIRLFVNKALENNSFEHILDHFSVLSSLISLIEQREDLKYIPLSALGIENPVSVDGPMQSVAHFFLNLLTKKRLSVIRHSSANIADFKNVVLLARCHIATNGTLRRLAAEIMPVEDVLLLMNDISTPRRIFKEVLSLLENHSDESVAERVHDTYLLDSSRMRDSLKELELSVQAYFDIIFQSLGYNKINEYLNVVRSIETTTRQLDKFSQLVLDELGSGYQTLASMLDLIKKSLRKKANIIYFDISPGVSRELESIFSIIEEIFKLKDMGLASLRPGTPQDIESEIRARARIIWQSAISIYLGRIKDLSEMIRKKIQRAAAPYTVKEELETEMRTASEELEKSYKAKIQCALSNTCMVCGKRGCAAERFLNETHFFIKEYLDNFIDP